MPKVKKIVVNAENLDIEPTDYRIKDTNDVGEIKNFIERDHSASANSLRILKQYLDSVIIPSGALTFDTIPKQGSYKPVTSDGIYRFILEAIDNYFNNKFIVLTQEEYDELEYYDPNKFYMIYELDPVEENDN